MMCFVHVSRTARSIVKGLQDNCKTSFPDLFRFLRLLGFWFFEVINGWGHLIGDLRDAWEIISRKLISLDFVIEFSATNLNLNFQNS